MLPHRTLTNPPRCSRCAGAEFSVNYRFDSRVHSLDDLRSPRRHRLAPAVGCVRADAGDTLFRLWLPVRVYPGEKRRFALLGVYGQSISVDPEIEAGDGDRRLTHNASVGKES
jgi:hypothetical protein